MRRETCRWVVGVLLCAAMGLEAGAREPQARPSQQKPQTTPAPRPPTPAWTPSSPKFDPDRGGQPRMDPTHPLYDPRIDPSSSQYDPTYDPKKDNANPLKDPNKDPGPATRGFGADIGAGEVKQLSGSWPWGEMFYGKEYPTSLEITNHCKTDEVVGIFISGLPYITLPQTVTVKRKSSLTVPIVIKTPPPPNPLITHAIDQPKIDRNVYTDISGSIVVWHPWRPPKPECFPKRTEYTVSGHIHFEPVKEEPPPSDPDAKLPEKIAGPDACQVWWNTGERPRQVKNEEDCIGRIRSLASEYRSRVLQSHADREPAAWTWLPTVEAIGGLSIGDLIAMKNRAATQINGKSSR